MIDKFTLPVYKAEINIFFDDSIDQELSPSQRNLKEEGCLALTGFMENKEDLSLFIYFNLDDIKEYEHSLEGTIDHEVLHLIFYIFGFYAVEIIDGGSNEHFTYLFNYIDEKVTAIVYDHLSSETE
jgi:hypothetical protein